MKPEALTSLVSCCNSCFFRMLYVYLSVLSFFLSLSQSTSFESSPFLALRASDRVHFERARSCVNGRSRAGVLVSFPNFSTLRFDLIAMASCSSWQRDSILRPSERMLSILPQDHGVLAGRNLNLY